jgi:hypothetical protein
MYRSMLARGGVVAASLLTVLLASPAPLAAAELAVPGHETYVQRAPNCGPCGCLTVRYVYHRQLETTYGASFDPRNFDTTEPHYYLGPVRRYPRYFVDGVPVSGPCRRW